MALRDVLLFNDVVDSALLYFLQSRVLGFDRKRLSLRIQVMEPKSKQLFWTLLPLPFLRRVRTVDIVDLVVVDLSLDVENSTVEELLPFLDGLQIFLFWNILQVNRLLGLVEDDVSVEKDADFLLFFVFDFLLLQLVLVFSPVEEHLVLGVDDHARNCIVRDLGVVVRVVLQPDLGVVDSVEAFVSFG